MNRQSYLNPSFLTAQCNEIIANLEDDNETIEAVRRNINNFTEDEEIQSEAFEALKQQMADYLLILDVMKGANNLDIQDCETLRSIVQMSGDVLDGDNISSQEDMALTSKADEEYKENLYAEKARHARKSLIWYYKIKSIYYGDLAASSEKLYQLWLKKEELYDDIDGASSQLFSVSPNMRARAKNALYDLQKSFQLGAYVHSDNAEWRTELQFYRDNYCGDMDWGQVTETEEGEILNWLNPNKKMSTDEIGEAKRLIGEYFSEGTIQYQLFNEPNTGYIKILRAQMTDEEFLEYQMMIALKNKCSILTSGLLGASSGCLGLTESIDDISEYILTSEGKTVLDEATLKKMSENARTQHKVAYNIGLTGSIGAQLAGMGTGEELLDADDVAGAVKHADDVADVAEHVDDVVEHVDDVAGIEGGSKTSTGIENLLNNRAELTGTTREKLLSTVQDSELAKIVNELYRPGATVGDGGTASILVEEFNNGSSRHLIKATERLKQLKSLSTSGRLGLNDLDVVDALINDLESAINLFN